ncbi:PP2C family protein-serine/threonine phosphatase [Microbacterium sp. NPDC055683]
MIDEQRRQRALEALHILDTPPDERVDRVTRLAQEIFDVPMVSVSLLDRDRQWRKSEIGLGGREAPREDSFCDFTVRQDATVVIEDASATAGFADNPFVVGDPHLRFYAGHPLHAPGGEPVGTLCILDTTPRAFGDDERIALQQLAVWVQTELARDQDLDHALLVQRTLAPRSLPRVPGWTIAAGAAARDRLSGDFHDVVLRDGVVRVTLADVMGKGTGPAIIASGVRASLRTAPERPLAAAVAEADRLLQADLGDTTMFVTAVHADVDTRSGRIDLVDAGHSLAFILRADGCWEHLRSLGLPLGMGMAGDDERTTTTSVLSAGDALVCCSDGLLDVLDLDDPFGQVAQVLRDRGPDGAVAEALRLARSEAATDDITVVVVRRDA